MTDSSGPSIASPTTTRKARTASFSSLPAAESYGVANDGIVGWVNVGYNHPDTRGRPGNAERQLAHDAIIAADPYVNFASYDRNGNGYITPTELHITIVAAGYGTGYGGSALACTPNLWSHRGAFGNSWPPAPIVDGKLVGYYPVGGGYTLLAEQDCTLNDPPGHMTTIGVMIHEMGHDLYWPDLYDGDYSSSGVGTWSVMGYGLWLRTTGYLGSKPSHPDAFSKWYQGWLTPYQASGTETGILIPEVETSPRVIQLGDNPGGIDWSFGRRSGTGEYFLVENRQQTGYDAGLPGCGLLIWHIDETRTSTNETNSTDGRRLVDLEEADGRGDLDFQINFGDTGDPYPGAS
ncbi:MAG: M6 family metalloprotease domain-containing protein [Ardenticatenaceae bacterium]|nr:M6 family metalloprotease domain-containing protein [Ardenticatenaceae bacterium]